MAGQCRMSSQAFPAEPHSAKRAAHAARRAPVSATGDHSQLTGSHWPHTKPRCEAAGEAIVTPTNSDQQFASLALKEDGAGETQVAFKHSGIPTEKLSCIANRLLST